MIMTQPVSPYFTKSEALDVAAFEALCDRQPSVTDYPMAARIQSRVPLYVARDILAASQDASTRRDLLEEWHRCLLEGPGVLVIQGMYSDTRTVDDASACFLDIIEREKVSGERGDHFAPPGSNDRIWNAFQKHGLEDPSGFVDYYANPLMALVCEAWLGPFYRITSQVNVVNPGGQAQSPHRDYHLGFQPDDIVSRFPMSMQMASQLLTLQGAIAHTDMPLETGPTQLLPYSQRYPQGYLAWRDPEFQAVFAQHHVQLPLTKGDGLFFNPALFHAAGANRSGDRRMANLLQVSSAFGQCMEAVDLHVLVTHCYPALQARYTQEGLSPSLQACIAAIAEGYAFPANLDRTPPRDGMAPETPQQLLERALAEGWSSSQLQEGMQQQHQSRQP
ncbi:phytanoyl-CoA dioxygenase family protein [Halomonas halodenitrificans]|uniref:phytanoyl-CoA dioxygenase family protein n=1 Tax=Halomonas halodenitrificans TaxID=28252 RepID=UPI000AD1DE26|nr:phytanoyl-CoA dioxygenase family protein [Halomonas halodenitrificans]